MINSKHLLTLITLAFLLTTSCKESPKADSSDSKSVVKEERDIYALPDWAKNATIYEVNLRQYTEEGTFNAFIEHLPRLKKMGVDILWFMPIMPISESKRKGPLGSYYAITDYAKVNPEHGTEEDFKKMLKAIHDQGMYMILDFVPNHTGWDSDWIVNHPEWFTQDKDGNVIDPIDPGTGESWGWTDVADLNYDNQEMRKEMIKDMSFWISDMGIDGFRMDVAHNVPQDFWNQASKALFDIKPIFMLAESEVESHRNEKSFHTTYGWSFHHILNEIAKGEKGSQDVKAWYEQDKSKFNHGFHMHFTSNHDENTWSGTVFDRMGDAHKALAVVTATMQGMPLLYGGQEEPMRHRLKFFEKDNIGFKDFAYAEFYTKLFDLKHRNKALWNGSFGDDSPDFDVEDQDILQFTREKDGDKIMSIVNLSDKKKTYKLKSAFKGTEIFSGNNVDLKPNDSVSLDPYAYKVYSNK